MTWKVICDDVINWAKAYSGPKFHAILCDPPYHLTSGSGTKGGFMGTAWDGEAGGRGIAHRPETWAALAKHLLPGGFVMAFGGARTHHRLAVAMEDAGLVMHPSIFLLGFLYGSGFPKATNIHSQAEKTLCEQIMVDGKKEWYYRDIGEKMREKPPFRHPQANIWYGQRYGRQSIKPALEPILVFQKPYLKGKKRWQSIVGTGAGALNIDKSRIVTTGHDKKRHLAEWNRNQSQAAKEGRVAMRGGLDTIDLRPYAKEGRWPANFLLSHVPPHWQCGDCGSRHPLQTEQPCPECGGELAWREGCKRVGTKRVKGSGDGGKKERNSHLTEEWWGQGGGGFKTVGRSTVSHSDPDGLETIADWKCVEGCPARLLGGQSGVSGGGQCKTTARPHMRGWHSQDGRRIVNSLQGMASAPDNYGDKGTCARFFFQADWHYEIEERLALADPVRYQAKASRRERDAGLGEEHPLGPPPGSKRSKPAPGRKRALGVPRRNSHPCIKPIALCRWLATLLLPPPEYAPRRIVVPFFGSGSEGIGAMLAGWEEIVGIEMMLEYVGISEARLGWWEQMMKRRGPDVRAILSGPRRPRNPGQLSLF